MLTSAQRAKLRGIAQNLDPIFNVGKNGITPNLTRDLSLALDLHELIKIGVLKNANASAKDVMAKLCPILGAEPVQAIGSRFVIYRRSEKEGIEHIEL